VENTEPVVPAVPVTEEQGSGTEENTGPTTVTVVEKQGSGIVENTEPVIPAVPVTEEQVQLIDEDDEELDATIALVQEPLVSAESASGVEDDAKDESEGTRKRRKGGKDQVSNLYDRLHPGNVSGKRRRTQRNPTGTSS